MPGLPNWEAIRNVGWSPEARVPAPISPHSDHGNGWVPRYQGQPAQALYPTDRFSNQPAWGPPACTWPVGQEDPRPPGHSGTHAPGPYGQWAPGPRLLSCCQASTEADGTTRPPASPTCCCSSPPEGSAALERTVAGSRSWSGAGQRGHPGPLAPVPALSNIPGPVSQQPRGAGCERGCPWPSTTLTSCAATAGPRAGLPHPHKALEPVSTWGQHQCLPAGLSNARGWREHSADTHHICRLHV